MSDWPLTLPSLVTALPTSPYDGQEIYYQADATNGILWHLRYNGNSGSSHKWEFLGGSEMNAVASADFTSTTGAGAQSYQDVTGASITVPLAGDYMVEFGGTLYDAGQAPTFTMFLTPKFGAAAAVDADGIQRLCRSGQTTAGQRTSIQSFRKIRQAGISASDVVKLQLRANVSLTTAMASQRAWLAITPVRVG